jgi:hypothetical protein
MTATATPPTPPRPAPPPPPSSRPSSNGTPKVVNTPRRSFHVVSGIASKFQRTVIYGPGGVGKSELCANLKQVGVRPLVLDIGNGTNFLDVERVPGIESWDDLRAALHDQELWTGFDAVVIDDLTKAEELAAAWTIANVPHEKGHPVTSVEGYGFGKGLTHVFETFLNLLGDLDAHVRAGRQVVCIAHECTSNVPNPSGEDWIRYEPRLQSPASGKSSIRHRIKEWCDHLLFVGYDTFVNKDGKAQGCGTRTIYPVEMPTHVAKSRCLSNPMPYSQGSADLWKQLFGGNV